MLRTNNGRLLSLVAAVAAAWSITACGDRQDRPSGSTSTTVTSPTTTTTTPPSNTAAPTAESTAATSSPSIGGGTLAAADREFFTLAASSDMLEIETGRLALDKSQNANVRTFAQKMIDEHMKANETLRQVASSNGVTPPASISSAHAAHLQKLQGLSGAEFDGEYAAQIGVAGHQEAVALFERASREAANADVRALAEKALPGKREHLELGQTLAKTVGVNADRMKTANAPPDLSSLSATIASGPNNTTSTTGSGSTSGTDVSRSATATPSSSTGAAGSDTPPSAATASATTPPPATVTK